MSNVIIILLLIRLFIHGFSHQISYKSELDVVSPIFGIDKSSTVLAVFRFSNLALIFRPIKINCHFSPIQIESIESLQSHDEASDDSANVMAQMLLGQNPNVLNIFPGLQRLLPNTSLPSIPTITAQPTYQGNYF